MHEGYKNSLYISAHILGSVQVTYKPAKHIQQIRNHTLLSYHII